MTPGRAADGWRRERNGSPPGPAVPLSLLRAALFTALLLVLSAGSHVLLSRAPLPAPTMAAAGAGAFALALLLGRRERSYGQIAALLVPLELALDTLFTTGQSSCYAGTGGGPITGPWHSVSTLLMCGGDPSAGGVPQAPAAGALAPWLVLAAHLLVGLAAAWWLRAGEAGAFRVLRAAAAAATAPLRGALALLASLVTAQEPAPSPPPRAPRPAALPAAPPLLHSVVRRGPPYGLRTACR